MRESTLLTNVLQPKAVAAGLARVTWHQFRHIHSSLLNDPNLQVKIAQEQLGHARPTSLTSPGARCREPIGVIPEPESLMWCPRSKVGPIIVSGQPPERMRRLMFSISWLIVALGCLVGLLACVALGLDEVSLSDRSPAWHLGWFGTVGKAFLGLAFLIGSLVALQHRRLAGVIFLTVMPVGAFCLAYPGSGFLVWRDGGGYFETPFPATAIGLAILFYAAFLPPLLMWRRKKRAAIAFALTAFIAGLIFANSRWTPALLPLLVGWSVPFLLPGLFWVRTDKLGWPSLVQARSWSLTKRVSAFAATCVALLCLDVVLTVILSGLGTSLYSGTCGGRQPFRHPLFPTQAVFTARVVFAARSIDALGDVHNGLRPSGLDRKVGDWAIGIVQERFWGMPHWTRLVLLTNYVYWERETYFVDGRRAEGLLTQFLPIVEGGIGCSRTKPLQDAIVDLRLLRRPPPPGGTRVMGYVRGPESFTPGIVRPREPAFIAGAKIEVTGPAWASSITTDSAGVYELDGLAPGDYTLQLSTPDTQTVGSFANDGSPAGIHLDNGGVVERNFELLWDGRIEGKVYDDSGTPARAWVMLLSADGRQIPGYVNFFEMTAKDGSYQFRRIPQGRYLVVVNPGGPDGERPYDIQYYPGAVRKEKAQVLELANGQRLGGISFRTPLLAERNTRVRVTGADGTAVAGAHVCVAYDNTDDYEALAGRHCIKDADQNGLAVIRTYGGSQVRIFAQQFVDRDDPRLPDRFHSQPVQYAADQIPNTVNLVLNSVKR